MTIKAMKEVLEHFENGGIVEARLAFDEPWEVDDNPTWNFQVIEYRISETPIEVTVYEYMKFTSNAFNVCWSICGRLMTEKEAESYFDGVEYQKTGRSWKVPKYR